MRYRRATLFALTVVFGVGVSMTPFMVGFSTSGSAPMWLLYGAVSVLAGFFQPVIFDLFWWVTPGALLAAFWIVNGRPGRSGHAPPPASD